MNKKRILEIIHIIISISALTFLVVGIILTSYQLLLTSLGFAAIGLILCRVRASQ